MMNPVVVAKILQEALRASWNFSSAHWLHHVKTSKNQILILKWKSKRFQLIFKCYLCWVQFKNMETMNALQDMILYDVVHI